MGLQYIKKPNTIRYNFSGVLYGMSMVCFLNRNWWHVINTNAKMLEEI